MVWREWLVRGQIRASTSAGSAAICMCRVSSGMPACRVSSGMPVCMPACGVSSSMPACRVSSGMHACRVSSGMPACRDSSGMPACRASSGMPASRVSSGMQAGRFQRRHAESGVTCWQAGSVGDRVIIQASQWAHQRLQHPSGPTAATASPPSHH